MSIKNDKELMNIFNGLAVSALETINEELGLEYVIEDGQITRIEGGHING